MRAYMIYSRFNGPQDGAALVFANSVQEARKVGWRNMGEDLTDEFTDLAARFMRDHIWLFDEGDAQKLKDGIPHVIEPKYCNDCELWGVSPIGDDGLCEGCRQDQRDDELRMKADMEVEENE